MFYPLKKAPKISVGLAMLLAAAPLLHPPCAEAKSKKKETAGGPPASAASSPATLVPDYPAILIGPGDLLQINVNDKLGDHFPTDYQVDSDGKIIVPYIGPVNLAGLTPNQATEMLREKMSVKYGDVIILLKESNTYWISVLGEVSKPGKYQIRGKPGLLSILSEAGGPAADSDPGHSIIIHDDVRTPVDLNQYLKGIGPAKPEPRLYPGDTLVVPKEGWPTFSDMVGLVGVLSGVALVAVEVHNLH